MIKKKHRQKMSISNAVIFNFLFKGDIRCKINFNMVFEHKCVLAVCVHNHPIMIKIHPVLFLNPHKS